jgi:predicted dehydrogenase
MRASVIGTGFGSSVVARIYQQLGIDVDVVSPREPKRVRAACAAPVDLVSVHSPPFLHRQHVLWALESGRNVLCDKPFGKSAAEAREMLDAATAAGVVHLANFEFRHDAARRQIKAWIDNGAIGTPRHVHWSRLSSGSRTPLKQHGWLFDQDSGGGWIGAYGSHVIDTLRWWVGEIDDVAGVRRIDMPLRPDADGVPRACTAEDAFSASFTFANGATATVDTAFAAAVEGPQQLQVLGSDGVIVLNGTTELTLRRAAEHDEKITFPQFRGDVHEPSFTKWAELIRDAIREGQQIQPSFQDAVACAQIMDKLKAAPLPEVEPTTE